MDEGDQPLYDEPEAFKAMMEDKFWKHKRDSPSTNNFCIILTATGASGDLDDIERLFLNKVLRAKELHYEKKAERQAPFVRERDIEDVVQYVRDERRTRPVLVFTDDNDLKHDLKESGVMEPPPPLLR